MNDKLKSIDEVQNFNSKVKTNWYNVLLVFILSLILIFSGLLWVQRQGELSGAVAEKERIAALNTELYKTKQYDIITYKVGTCTSLPCDQESFSEQTEIASCDERAHVAMTTVVRNNVTVTLKLSFRLLNLDNSFSYVDEKQFVQGPRAIEVRKEPKTVYLSRPKNWFCLPPGRYQEQATVEYEYENEVGDTHKNYPAFSNIFVVK